MSGYGDKLSAYKAAAERDLRPVDSPHPGPCTEAEYDEAMKGMVYVDDWAGLKIEPMPEDERAIAAMFKSSLVPTSMLVGLFRRPELEESKERADATNLQLEAAPVSSDDGERVILRRRLAYELATHEDTRRDATEAKARLTEAKARLTEAKAQFKAVTGDFPGLTGPLVDLFEGVK